jgi:maleamate amidohydrolase
MTTGSDRRWWQEPFTEEAPEVYRTLRRRMPPRGRTALLLIDVVRSFVGPPVATLEEAVREWPTSCGPDAHAALPQVDRLLSAGRAAGVPIIHCRPGAENARFTGDTVKGELDGEWVNARPGAVEFVAEAAPRDGELVLPKPKASAFFETPLATSLHNLQVGTVVVAGCTTSGCVRASVVDAFSHGFTTYVAEEAVFDRSRLSAAASLWDMDARYADVVGVEEAISVLQRELEAVTDTHRASGGVTR